MRGEEGNEEGSQAIAHKIRGQKHTRHQFSRLSGNCRFRLCFVSIHLAGISFLTSKSKSEATSGSIMRPSGTFQNLEGPLLSSLG